MFVGLNGFDLFQEMYWFFTRMCSKTVQPFYTKHVRFVIEYSKSA